MFYWIVLYTTKYNLYLAIPISLYDFRLNIFLIIFDTKHIVIIFSMFNSKTQLLCVRIKYTTRGNSKCFYFVFSKDIEIINIFPVSMYSQNIVCIIKLSARVCELIEYSVCNQINSDQWITIGLIPLAFPLVPLFIFFIDFSVYRIRSRLFAFRAFSGGILDTNVSAGHRTFCIFFSSG